MNVSKYEEIQIGNEYSFSKVFTQNDVEEFARLSGDTNPLHLDAEYSRKTKLKKPIIHGMLVASLFSRIIGMYCPGKHGIYMSQNIKFRKPVYTNNELTVHAKVVKKMDALKIITLETFVKDAKTGELLVSGEAIAQVF